MRIDEVLRGFGWIVGLMYSAGMLIRRDLGFWDADLGLHAEFEAWDMDIIFSEVGE